MAAVILLIGLATTIFTVVSRERPVTAIGAPRADVAANLSASNAAVPTDAPSGEPLAQIGLAPAASPTPAPR